ncbi:metallophosphoesterase family protein [Moraxella boevrei]|uniref:metallophosphoesterase family protein n=1 Tax=Faucicola boevrei TaxID=346665 RepID=UPI003734E75E
MVNVKSRTFVFGDIHGCFAMLDRLLVAIDPQSCDTLIFLGDMIDRGDDSRGVIDKIRELENFCQVIAIMGNHEEMLLNALKYKDELKYWLKYGGVETLQSFGQTADLHGILAIPHDYIRWLKNLKNYHETENFIFTHATPFADISMEKQTENGLRWQFLEAKDTGHMSGKTLICGHSAQKNGEVLKQNNIICIDTYAHGGGNLTTLELDTMRVWQVNTQLEIFQKLI